MIKSVKVLLFMAVAILMTVTWRGPTADAAGLMGVSATLQLNEEHQDQIENIQEIDWYQITTVEDGRLNANVTTGYTYWGNLAVKVELYDSDKLTLLKTGETYYGAASISYENLMPGTYFLKVIPTDAYGSPGSGDYVIGNTFTAPQEANDDEPNDTMETAQLVDKVSVSEGHLGYYSGGASDSKDWYKVDVQQDGTLDMKVVTGSNYYVDLAVNLELYNSGGKLLSSGNTYYGAASVTHPVLEPGSYYLKVTPASDYGSKGYGTYTLESTFNHAIQLDGWNLTDNGNILKGNEDQVYFSVDFMTLRDLTAIEYTYSVDGSEWQPFPILVHEGALTQSYWDPHNWSRRIEVDLSDMADGTYRVRARAIDTNNNELTVEKPFTKDTGLPLDVVDFTAVPNSEGTGIVLNWTNPSDVDHVTIERKTDKGYFYQLFTFSDISTYTDLNVTPGIPYEYRITAFDAQGNKSEKYLDARASIPVNGPILQLLYPYENAQINGNTGTINYNASFIDDNEILSILFEISEDGENWTPLNDSEQPIRNESYYSFSGYWDISSIEVQEVQIRVTAEDALGRRVTTEPRMVHIDRVAPEAPANFSLVETESGRISLTWSASEDAEQYKISRTRLDQWDWGYVWYTDQLAQLDPYFEPDGHYQYTVQAYDSFNNYSEPASVFYHKGPDLTIDGDTHRFTNIADHSITGSTSAGSTVTINGESVIVDEEGRFSHTVTLAEGENSYTVSAEDANGAAFSKELQVTLDQLAPTVNRLDPGENAVIGGQRVSSYIEASDDHGVVKFELQVSLDDGQTWETVSSTDHDINLYWQTYYTTINWDAKVPAGNDVLTDGVYKFRAIAYDKAGNASSGTPVRIWKVDNTAPAAPTGLTVNNSVDRFQLSWSDNADTDIARYILYRSDTPGTGYVKYRDVYGTSYTESQKSGGEVYYYVITGVDQTGNESGFSNEAAPAPLMDEEAPVLYDDGLKDGDIIGGPQPWLGIYATDASPLGIKSYKIEYSTDEGVTWKAILDSYYGGVNWNTAGLNSGSVQLRYSAMDYSGNRAERIRNLILDLEASKPDYLSAAAGEGTVNLTWDAVNDSDFSYYQVLRSQLRNEGYGAIYTSYSSAETTYTDRGVSLDRTYYYKIRHVDKYGNTMDSSAVWMKPADDMTDPVVTRIDPASSSDVGGPAIHFTAWATDNKAAASMNASYSADDGATWTLIGQSPAYSNGTDFYSYFGWNTEGLASGSYRIKVAARDAAGNEGDAEFTWNVDLNVDSTANVRTTSEEDGITIAWDLLQDTDLYEWGAYLVKRSDTPEGPYTNISGWLDRNTTSFKDHIALPQDYYYIIQTQDKWGNINISGEVQGNIQLDETPPVIESVTPETGTTLGGAAARTLQLQFSDNAGMTGTRAAIEFSADGENWTDMSQGITGPYGWSTDTYYFNVPWHLSPLTSGTYQVRVKVYDALENMAERTLTYHIDRTAPAAPQELIAEYGSGIVSLSWAAAPEADVAAYRILRATSQAGPFTEIARRESRTDTSYNDHTVQPGLTYFYQVKAIDKFQQEGGASNTAAAAAQTDSIPPVILGMEPEDRNLLGPNAQITVRAEDNLALASITLQYSTVEGEWIHIGTRASSGTTVFEWNTAPLNGEVKVRAIAKDSAGNVSGNTTIRTYTVDTTGPAQVTGVIPEAGITSVLLNWNDVPDQDFSYFQVEYKDEEQGEFLVAGTVANFRGFNVTGLQANHTYWFRVAAYDRQGNRGTSSDPISVTTADDRIRPVITGLEPLPNSFDKQILLGGRAADNIGVASFTFQYSDDMENWTEIATVQLQDAPTNAYATSMWDVSGLAEGKYYVRGAAADSAGNVSSTENTLYAEYFVDHTAPAQTSGLEITADSGYLTLMWEQGTETDLSYYRVYKADTQEGPYTLLADKYPSLEYRDRNAEPGQNYFYKIAAVDRSGIEGEASAIGSGQLLPDEENPVIRSITSGQQSNELSANPKIYVLASDNYRLAEVSLEYAAELDAEPVWAPIGSHLLNSYGEVVTFDWNTAGLTDGNYLVRAKARDISGNEAVSDASAFELNVQPPAAPAVTAEASGWTIKLSWDEVQDEDLAGYRIYRGTTKNGPYTKLKETAEISFTDSPLAPGRNYYYIVESVDYFGNSTRSVEIMTSPTPDDPFNPTAEAGDEQMVTYGMEVGFDGTLSKDNNRIERYVWDFGDGVTSELAQPSHSYPNIASTYTVSLTVYDPAGNSHTDTTQVSVKAPEFVGTVDVRVLNGSGLGLSGASVVIQYPDGTSIKTTTNGNGIAKIVASPGNYKVYAYSKDYLPSAIDVTVRQGQQPSVHVTLQKGELVTGELKVERMTLDQIKAAGIAVDAPENQWVYKFETHLAFNNQPLPKAEFIVNGAGQFVGGAPSRIVFNSGGASGGGGGVGATYYAYPTAIPHANHPEVQPTIAYLVIPGEARWMKEFFEVSLLVTNHADPQFVIEQAEAELKLPEGLALAPTGQPQSLKVELVSTDGTPGEIAGQQSGTAKWIIRGDQKGSYNLEALFSGILQPFGDAIDKRFMTEEPFRVWGEDALQMIVDAQDRADKGHPYHVRYGLKNVADDPNVIIYNATIELKDEGKQNFIFAPNQELSQVHEKLQPGETVWFDYWLIPTIDGDLDLTHSFVLHTGGTAAIPTEIISHSVPGNLPGAVPVLRSTLNTDETVTLNWDPVDGAIKYRVYSLRDDLYISREAELVYEGTETMTVAAGGKHYAVMTVTTDGERLYHPTAIQAVTDPNPSDGVSPVWPEGSKLAAAGTGETWLTLTWNAAEDIVGVTQYAVYLGEQLFRSVDGGTTSLKVTGLTPGQEYQFRVEAGDHAGNWSSGGPSATVSTKEVEPPAGAGIKTQFQLYLGNPGSDLNQSSLSGLDMSAVNKALENVSITIKTSEDDPGVTRSGSQYWTSDEQGNLAVIDHEGRVVSELRLQGESAGTVTVIVSGAGYHNRVFENVTLEEGSYVELGNGTETEKPIELVGGDTSGVSEGALTHQQDGQINNIDFSAWLEVYRNAKKGEATAEEIIMADFSRDGEINAEDYKLWLEGYKKVHYT